MAGFCTLEFDQHMIRLLRLVKSPAEIEVMREAGKLLDASLDAVIAAARPGVMDSTLTATYLSVVLGGGGDMPPNAPLFNSGARALYGRGVSRPRRLEPVDQIVVEYPVAVRRYNVKTEWTILLGGVTDPQRRMFDTVRATLDRMTAITRPGTTLGELFDAHANGLDAAGYAAAPVRRHGLFRRAHLRPHQHGCAADDLHRQSYGMHARHGVVLPCDAG